MEAKKKSLSMGSLKSLSATEKRCIKCGFVTFCLRVLYSHRYKCQGKLLGSLMCCYCKRKFNYLVLFKSHKKTCVKFQKNKKLLNKHQFKNLIAKKGRKYNKAEDPFKLSVISCADCLKTFSSKQEYEGHLKAGFCNVKNLVKKQSFSARKSFSKVYQEIEQLEIDGWPSDLDEVLLNDSVSSSMSVKKRFASDLSVSGVSCKWCKNTYPTKEILQSHLKKNYQCALQQSSHLSPIKKTYQARKSFGPKRPVVARKSFSLNASRNLIPSFSYAFSGGSARKSLPNSKRRFLQNFKSPLMSPVKTFNQCPVCYVSFSESFEFFQHQKRLNHWGKATKSISTVCKCPFCEKRFFHIHGRNAHLQKHTDKSEEEIELFLKNSTCNICSKMFASETTKYQHVKLEHSKTLYDVDSKENRNNKQSLLPLVIKQKLREYPNTCPICSKKFPSVFSRDKHFKKKHLDSELECKFCPQRYNTVEDLEYHMQKAHYNSFKFECLACKINLATAPHVVLHVTKLHADQDPKKIIRSRDNESALFDEQGFSSNMPRNNRNKQAEFYCDICKVSFQRLCGLQSHRQSKSHRDTVVKNLDSMHKSLSDLPPLPSPPPIPKKKVKQPEILTCSECLEEFTTVKDFVPHRLSHFGVQGRYLRISEENLYTCEICGEVSNSHSKVQLHLFWHLQVESTSTEKKPVTVKDKNDPIVPDRLSGQHVAKKSFAKQSSELQQEVVIGGVKKPLFTCENCNIGFTTQAHYSLHVRKFCRKKNASLTDNTTEKEESSLMHLPGISTLWKQTVNIKDSNLELCNTCNCLFSSSVEELHKSFCKICAVDDAESKKDLDHITSNINLESVIGVCVLCALPFDDSQAFANHMLTSHKSAPNNVSMQKTENNSTVHCTACNSLFFCPEAMKDHNSFCSNSSCCDFDADSVKDILKAASKLEHLIAACISCSLAFDNVDKFNEHMLTHKEPDFNRDLQNSLDVLPISSDDGIIESASINATDALSFDDLEQVSAQIGNSKIDGNDPSDNLDSSSSQLPDDSAWTVTKPLGANQSSDFEEDNIMEPIDKLRNNFSQLFCMLINDSELMQQLGFGEQPVDDVLTKVLQQMGQNPVLKDGQTPDIDCLRKNIRTLLDFCLKDQIMELIGSGKTSTDEIVIEALKIFSAEKTAVVAE